MTVPAEEDGDWPQEPVPLPITGELDLHAFRAGEVGDLLRDYLRECRRRGLLSVRVVHGKGTGALRAGVHALLQRLPEVREILWPLGVEQGGWGATRVRLAPWTTEEEKEGEPRP